MSHINLYSVPTDVKNMIRCRFCEKIYKIDNGSSGFIRHLRCKHPEFLHNMGGIGSVNEHSESPGKETKPIFNNLFSSRNDLLLTENFMKNDKIGEEEDDEMVVVKEVSSNQILANFVSQMDFSQIHVNRVAEKRPRISPTPITNQSIFPIEDRSEEPEVKIFSGGETLKNFLIDIENQVRLQNKETFENNETGGGDASTSASALDAQNSPKSSNETSPNSSLLGEINGGTETVDSPIQITPNPLNPFGCVICPCSFPRINDLTIHVGHVHRTRFRCNCCMAEFVQPQHLEHHYSMCHGNETTPNSQ